ncbi:MAG: MerR family transcriptional regulator [Gemmatimonadetes bacterium]|nr:MerR family transcriptional regulator [Gemmatimonadota bacterium]
MRIGTVAARAGVNVQTLRYYERRGLLARPERSPSGYREYGPETVRIIRFIKRAQELGFTLREIQDLLRLREAGGRNRRRARQLAGAKIQDVDQKIWRLQSIKRALVTLVESCACAGSEPECPILEALDDDAVERNGGAR